MINTKNEVLLLLTDHWCDWEASYAIAVANSFSDYVVRTISFDNLPKVSMGVSRLRLIIVSAIIRILIV